MPVSSPSTPHQVDSSIIDPGYQEAIDFLYGRINYERSPGLAKAPQSFRLDRMRTLLKRLGNPHLAVPCVHIAGTKGKGSTATMVARILEAAGYRVGLYTSPHAHRVEERFTINGALPAEGVVVAIVEQIKQVAQEMDADGSGSPTFFELVTAAGWLYFLNNQVDIAVVEVGLGGRLDSTNVCQPLVTIITSISKDHTQILGDTEELIAREKAGIIKPDVPVISGVLHPGAAKVIKQVASETLAPLSELGRDFQVSSMITKEPPDALQPGMFTYVDSSCELRSVQLAMPGEHQIRNAALAITAVRKLATHGLNVSVDQIRAGLLRARVPFRIEVVSDKPSVVIDAAHNPASIAALCQTLKPMQAAKRICVFGSSRDKDCAELLRLLDQTFDEFVLTAYSENPRAIPVHELEQLAQGILQRPFVTAASPEVALRRALSAATTEDLVCITGSFFLAAEAQKWWERTGGLH